MVAMRRPAALREGRRATTPGEAVSYRLRDDQPPFLESVVTLQIVPDAGGGSLLRIIHQLDAANDGPTTMMCAA